MKKIVVLKSAVLAFLLCVGLVSCNEQSEENQGNSEGYTVKLGLAGEMVDVSYTPLTTRSTTDNLYGINVYSAPNKEDENVTWTRYAYGLFDDPEDISINLLKGYKYKFEATIVTDGKNRVEGESAYRAPFTHTTNSLSTSTSVSTVFDYTGSIFDGLRAGKTFLKNDAIYDRPNLERFYGVLVDFVPDQEGATASIDMKRASFGAKFIVSGALATEGTLHIRIAGAPAMELALTEGDDQIYDIFTFHTVGAVLENDQYEETVQVAINWEQPDESVVTLGSHNITFKRNKTTVVNVKIESNGLEGGVGFVIDENEQGPPADDEAEITIEDGELVETEIETN